MRPEIDETPVTAIKAMHRSVDIENGKIYDTHSGELIGTTNFESPKSENRVDHPSHYTWLKDLCGIEVIDITRHMDFDLGNAIKYILRCGHKSEANMTDKDKTIEDLKKAIWYINDKIKLLELDYEY